MPGRWLYSNLVTAASMITPGSTAAGLVGGVVDQSSGSAEMSAQGGYTGDDDVTYTVQIDSVSAGAEVGSATFRWRRSDSSAWEASGVATSSSLVLLDRGVSVKWSSGSGDDFVVNDLWTIKARKPFGRQRLLDASRQTEHRTTGVSSENYVIDLGSAQQVTALVLADHNLTSGATASLQANSADSWGSPAYSQALSITSPHLVLFLDQTYRYWRVTLTDAGNADGYLRASLLYLGAYFEPGRNFAWQFQRTSQAARQDVQEAGVLAGATVTGISEMAALSYNSLSASDLASMQSMFEAVHNVAAGRADPIWFCPDSAAPSDIIYGLPAAQFPRSPRSPSATRFKADISITEIPRGAV